MKRLREVEIMADTMRRYGIQTDQRMEKAILEGMKAIRREQYDENQMRKLLLKTRKKDRPVTLKSCRP